ncbi:hypothetical protein LEP1GSC179_4180 [Leptospira santarosai str. MOR084]|uniref:Uncharacterized protein n=1 Tax=Leptospira santarosai str. MOR084 TaxID=1049984 RepID=A0A0E2BKQ4_9LEPT|nr:hypothetical protein LEP1GSC179_4180 [Leptospira santarosai str. MOR084]
MAFPRIRERSPNFKLEFEKARELSSLGLFCVRFGKNRRRYDKDLKLGFCFTKVEFSDIRNFLKISNKPHLALRPVEM